MGVLPLRVCKLQGKHGDHKRQRQLTCTGCRCLVEELKKNLQKSNPDLTQPDQGDPHSRCQEARSQGGVQVGSQDHGIFVFRTITEYKDS